MRSQTLALSFTLFLTSVSFGSTVLTQETASKINLKMESLTFEKGQPVQTLGKFNINSREIKCRMADSRAEHSEVYLNRSDLNQVRLVSHFPDKGIVKLVASGKSEKDPGVQMECTYQAIQGKKANTSPISVEDFQSYFDRVALHEKWLQEALDKFPQLLNIYMTTKIRDPRYSEKYLSNDFKSIEVGTYITEQSGEHLTMDSNPPAKAKKHKAREASVNNQ